MGARTDVEFSAVKCDEDGCGWIEELPFDDIPKWHNKPCPKCGNGIIINDGDKGAWAMTKALLGLQAILDPDNKQPKVTVRISTDPNREAK